MIFIDINLLVLGFMGGIVRVFFEKESPTPREVVGYIVVGGFASNIFTPLILLSFTLGAQLVSQIPEGFLRGAPWPLAFVIGMGGLRICKAADRWLGRKIRRMERTKNE